MVNYKIIGFSVLFFLMTWTSLASSAKVALIIAIGNYPVESGWVSLNTSNDIELIRNALVKQGFEEKDITILRDKEATHNGIIAAINKHLIQKAQKGGTAVLHFSGHGQQVFDNDGDEIDHFDEAIVPYDSPMYFKKGVYEGERLIRDEELGKMLFKLRKKLGKKGQTMVLLDACHSGTGTRGYSKARGSDVKMASQYFLENNKNIVYEYNSLEEGSKVRQNIAPLVSFFASSANELNYETRDQNGIACGSFSYAFNKAFYSIEKNTTYKGLFDQIKLEMAAIAPRQSPQAEGNLDQLILGGEIVGNPKHYNVLKVYDDIIVIDGGTLAGLNPNTTLLFYPIDTRDTTKIDPIARGFVRYSELFTCEIQLDKVLGNEQILGAWGFVESQNYGDLSVQLKLNIQNNSLEESLKEKIEELPVIQLTDISPDLILNSNDDKRSISLITKDDFILYEGGLRHELSHEQSIITEILNFAQARFIRNLNMQDQWIKLEMELIPFIEKNTPNDTLFVKSNINTKTGKGGVIRFNNGDKFRIRITNNGDKPAYFALLDVQPDNKINLVFPEMHLKRKAEEYFILPDQTLLLPEKIKDVEDYWTFGPPYGNEVFKLIATREPINLKSVIRTRGVSNINKKNQHPFEILFGATFENNLSNSRGSALPAIPPNSAQIYSLVFRIGG